MSIIILPSSAGGSSGNPPLRKAPDAFLPSDQIQQRQVPQPLLSVGKAVLIATPLCMFYGAIVTAISMTLRLKKPLMAPTEYNKMVAEISRQTTKASLGYATHGAIMGGTLAWFVNKIQNKPSTP